MILNQIPIPKNSTASAAATRAIRVLNASLEGAWIDPSIQNSQFTDQRAGAIFRMWRALGAHPKTALWATLIAYRESRFDGTAVNPDSGALGLYQALSPEFKRVAIASSKLEDALPVMKVMMRMYQMQKYISLHSLYAMHFQGKYAARDVDSLRGFIDAKGSTYGAQYATTNGKQSANDLALLSISALMDLPKIARIDASFILHVPTQLDDRRDQTRPDYPGPVAIYKGVTHLARGVRVTADSADVEGDFAPFKSNPAISVTYTNPHVYYAPIISFAN